MRLIRLAVFLTFGITLRGLPPRPSRQPAAKV